MTTPHQSLPQADGSQTQPHVERGISPTSIAVVLLPVAFIAGLLGGKSYLGTYEGETAKHWHDLAKDFKQSSDNARDETANRLQLQAQLDGCLHTADTDRWDYLVLNGEIVKDASGKESVRADQHFFDEASAERERARDLCFRRYQQPSSR